MKETEKVSHGIGKKELANLNSSMDLYKKEGASKVWLLMPMIPLSHSHVKAVTGSGCQLALAPASTAQHISTCLHFYTMRCDLIYNIQERQDTKVEDYLQ